MKIDIKPTLITVDDYHEFSNYTHDFMGLGFNMDIFEIDNGGYYTGGADYYNAVTWVKGSEDELFEFIFTNEEVWKLLIDV
jgi:hypothetical protein